MHGALLPGPAPCPGQWGGACALLPTPGDRVLSPRKALGPADTSPPPPQALLKLDNSSCLCRKPGSLPCSPMSLATHPQRRCGSRLTQNDQLHVFQQLLSHHKGKASLPGPTNSRDCPLPPSLRLVNCAGCWAGQVFEEESYSFSNFNIKEARGV